jgi:hypothetical protein
MKRVMSLCGPNKKIILLKALVHVVNHSDLRGQYSIELFSLRPRLMYVGRSHPFIDHEVP